MERFFPLDHLTVEQLHELYRDACEVGKRLIEYDKPGEKGQKEIDLPKEMILENITTKGRNYLAFQEDFDDRQTRTTVAFPLAGYPFTTVYVDMDNSLLDWFVKKYHLNRWWHMEGGEKVYHTFSEFYTLEPMKRITLN